MTTQECRRKAGRPPKYDASTKPRHLSIRLPADLFARLEAAAAEQNVHITHVTTRALTHFLENSQIPDLAVIDAGLVIMAEAYSQLETQCGACPTCKPHVTATLNVAWPKLTAALDALSPEQGA